MTAPIRRSRRSRAETGRLRALTEVEAASGSRDLVDRMQRRCPDHGNPSALILSAVTALRRNQPDHT